LISGFSENLNYPSKLYAILELIDEKKMKEQYAAVNFQEKTIAKNPKTRGTLKNKKVATENLAKIAKKNRKSTREIAFLNPQILNINAPLLPGMTIRV
jgi:hypothetical protein